MNGLEAFLKIGWFAAALFVGFVSLNSLRRSNEILLEKVVVVNDQRNY